MQYLQLVRTPLNVLLRGFSPVRARGLSRECVLRIPSVIVKGD